ncbi:MAG: hypothetical protein IJW04_05565 [Ruminococcus sp.]|nr:hypothetical protein [Ruminococcus sp.]
MKDFKKIICALLSVMLILSLTLPCFAEEINPYDNLENAFMRYCTGKVPMHIEDVKEVTINDTYTIDNVVVFSADSWKWKDHGRVDKNLLGWEITANHHHFPYDFGVYVYSGEEIFTLEEAIEAELLSNLDFLDDFDGIKCVHQDLIKKCSEAFLKYKNESTSDEVWIECNPRGKVEGYRFFTADITRNGEMYPTIVVEDMIGDYIYRAGRPYGPKDNPIGLYAMYEDGTVCPARELYDKGILTDKQIAEGAGGIYSTELDKYGELEFEEIIIPELKEKYDYFKESNPSYSEIYTYYGNRYATNDELPEYVLIHVFPRSTDSSHQTAHIINDMVFEQWYNGVPFVYGYGIYIFETGEFYDLTEVPDLDLEGKAYIYKSVNYRYRMGDNNKDYNLTIQDATLMQKCLAKLSDFREDDEITKYFHKPEKRVYISDYNRDGVRNIKDATAIQKRIAKITE